MSDVSIHFVFDLEHKHNVFTLYLGGIFVGLFMIIFIIALTHRRKHTVVTQLAKPESDAHVHEYILMLKTSFRMGSAMTRGARMTVELIGTFCNSKRYTLMQKVMRQRILHRAHADIFVLYTPMDIGELQAIRCTLLNFSERRWASWRPCFIEVMKSTTRERWGVSANKVIKCEYKTTETFPLVKGLKEHFSFFKLIMKYHQWIAPFTHPQRFGAFNTFTSVLFFFFTQSTLMTTTMCAYVLAYLFLGKLRANLFLRHYFEDLFSFTQLAAAMVAVILQQLELLLRRVRPCPQSESVQKWNGLWRNDFSPNLLNCDVGYDWDRPPCEFSACANRFSSTASLSTIDTSSQSSQSSLVSFSSSDEALAKAAKAALGVEKKKIPRDASLNMLRHCVKLSKKGYTYISKPKEQVQPPTWDIKIGQGRIVYEGEKAVIGTSLQKLTEPLPRAYCQFCTWVKHFSVRGETLKAYATSLTHNMRRAIQAIRTNTDPAVAVIIMTVCINQWVGSLCSRMLQEVVTILKEEEMDDGGLDEVLNALLSMESNLWFSQVGHRQGPLAGSKTDNSHTISNLYFSIMRDLVQCWKKTHPVTKSILKRPSHELFPRPEKKPRGLKWDTKIRLLESSTAVAELTKAENAPETSVEKKSKSVGSKKRESLKTGLKGTTVRPEALRKMCEIMQSYAHVVQFKVNAPFGTQNFCCCQKQLCQAYAVMFSQFKNFAYRIVYHLVAQCLSKRTAVHLDTPITVKNEHEVIRTGILKFIITRARMMQKLGRSQNKEAIDRMQQELIKAEAEVLEVHSLGSLDSLNRSRNNPMLDESTDSDDNPQNESESLEYTAFKFGRRAAHHGLVEEWTHAPYPFAQTVLPPLKLSWQGDDERNKSVNVAESSVDAMAMKSTEKGEDGTDGIVETVILNAQEELRKEAEWVMGLKESLAAVVAFARIDILKELEDPLQIAVAHFTHALLVLFFEALLPQPEEENFVVTADDIRQRRRRVGRKARGAGRYDLTEVNNPGYDLNFLDFVVVDLCERWEMAKLEYQHGPTLHFLVRCLTMANLDTSIMTHLEDALMATRMGTVSGIVMDRMTHVHETEQIVAVAVNEVMALTLVYVVPETLESMKHVTGWLGNDVERVTYVCEKVSLLEHQVRHKLSRRIAQAASRKVQKQLMIFEQRRTKFVRRETKMLNLLRSLVKEKMYYDLLTKEFRDVKEDLKDIQQTAYTIYRVTMFMQARSVSRYARNTIKLQRLKVQDTVYSLTEPRWKDPEYTERQYAEVEWIMTGAMDKALPSVCMNVAMILMFIGTLANLFVIIVLGASFQPSAIGTWFSLHGLAVAMVILILEPFKCIWEVDFGWEQPTK